MSRSLTKETLDRYRQLLIVLVLSIGVDQASKAVASATIPSGDVIPLIEGFIDLRLRHNPGVGWGLGGEVSPHLGRVIYPALGALVTLGLFLLYRRLPRDQGVMRLGVALLLGGGVGNLIDRVRLGVVVDFIAVHVGLGAWNMSGTFNPADVAMVTGVVVIASTALRRRSSGPDEEGGSP